MKFPLPRGKKLMMASPFDEAVTNTEKNFRRQTDKLQAEQKNQPRNRSCQNMRRLKRRLIELSGSNPLSFLL